MQEKLEKSKFFIFVPRMVLMWLMPHHIMKEFPKLKALHCK